MTSLEEWGLGVSSLMISSESLRECLFLKFSSISKSDQIGASSFTHLKEILQVVMIKKPESKNMLKPI